MEQTQTTTDLTFEPQNMRSLDLSAASHKGKVRFIHEDHMSLPIERQADILASKGYLMAVADGAGGQASGMIAAEIATRLISNTYYNDPDEDIVSSLQGAFAAAQEAILQEQIHTPDHAEMTSTLCVAVLRGVELVIANVGNSRCYRWRKGILRQLSNDHTEVGERVRSGVMAADKLKKDRALHGQLTRLLGSPKISPEPEILEYDWQADDRLLLCSDGVWDMIPDEKITELLVPSELPVDDIAESFVKVANAEGGADNISAVVVLDTFSMPAGLRKKKPKITPVKFAAGVGVALAAGAIIGTVGVRALGGMTNAAPRAVITMTPLANNATKPAIATMEPTLAVVATPVTLPTPTTPDTAVQVSAEPSGAATDIAGIKTCLRRSFKANQCSRAVDTFGLKERAVYISWSYEDLGKPTEFDIVLMLNGNPVYKSTCKVARGTRCTGARGVSPQSLTLTSALLKRKTFAAGDYEIKLLPKAGTTAINSVGSMAGQFKVE